MSKIRIPVEDYLAKLPLFRELGNTTIGRLASGTAEIDAPRETPIFRRGAAAAGFYIVVIGQIKVSLEPTRRWSN